jgi:protein-tyrosine phosphatase
MVCSHPQVSKGRRQNNLHYGMIMASTKQTRTAEMHSDLLAILNRSKNDLERRYGGKAGLIRHYVQLARHSFGVFSYFQNVNWGEAKQLIFVCKGNVCRSAYAECKSRAMGLCARSCGLRATEHSHADPTAIEVARGRGIDLTSHRTSAFDPKIGDLLIAMEPYQAEALRNRVAQPEIQVTLLGLWCIPLRPHIEDPFGLSRDYFTTCFDLVDNALEQISSLIERSAAPCVLR